MSKTIHATYDGQVLRPDEPLDLPPNARVTVTINGTPERAPVKPYESLDYLASLNLDGPADASERVDRTA